MANVNQHALGKSPLTALTELEFCLENGEGESEHHFESSSSNSDSSTFDFEENDNQQLVQGIFGDSDSDEEDDFEGFAMEMPENVQWPLRGQPVQEHDDLHTVDQPDPWPVVILDQNAQPLDIFPCFLQTNLLII